MKIKKQNQHQNSCHEDHENQKNQHQNYENHHYQKKYMSEL